MKKILYIMLIIGLIFVLNSCDSSTSSSNDKITINGVVKLVDLNGNETLSDEVTVAVFEKNVDDVTWDYRLENPIIVTKTNDYGEFSYKADDSDNFIVYFLKEDYSIKGYNQKDLSESVLLYENLVISGSVTNQIILDGTSDLVVVGDLIIIDNGSLIVNELSRIRISAGVKVIIHSSIEFFAPVIITSDDSSYFWSNEEIEAFLSFEVTETATIANRELVGLTLSYSYNGFIIRTTDLSIRDSNFINSGNGLYLIESNDVLVENIICKNIYEETNAGVYLERTNNIDIRNSSFEYNINGIKSKESNNINFYNNKFSNNSVGFLSYQNDGLISHNVYENNHSSDIFLMGNSHAGEIKIEYNNFSSDTAIHQRGAASWPYFNRLIINNNNFINNNQFINYYSSSLDNDIDGTNNYYNGLTSVNGIIEKITDLSPSPNVDFQVNIIPFKTRFISSAGILPD